METAKAVRIGRALAEADLVIIGASNGLDMAEGLNLFCADAHFQEAYGDLAHPDALAMTQLEELERLVQAHRNGRVAILELGVGLRNGIIKHMLAQIANVCEHATYIVFNYSQAMAPDASCETILVDGDMAPAFEEIAQCRL